MVRLSFITITFEKLRWKMLTATVHNVLTKVENIFQNVF